MGRSRGPLTDEDGSWLAHRSKRRRIVLGVDSLDSGSTGDGKRPPMYHCNYCHKDISGTIRMKCAKCPDYDLCVECVSVGAETYPHKCNHPYRVMDNLAFPLMYPDWSADEEILLLEAISMYGVGNWGDVGEHVGTKTKAQCYEHYVTAYMNSPFSPLPDMTQVMGKSRADLWAMARLHMDGKINSSVGVDPLRLVKQEFVISPARIKIEDVKELAVRRSPPGLLGSCKDSKVEGDHGEGNSGLPTSSATNTPGDGQAKESTANAEDQTGYNSKRHEFDPEYDNDAELQLADMEFKDNDTETDRELKLRVLHIYLARLDERQRRKDFVIGRGLVNVKKQQALDRKRTREERELYQQTRIFLRYHSSDEHEALLNGLNAERKIRQRIEELQEMRSQGCRLLAEGELYFFEKKKRETEETVRKVRDSPSSGVRTSQKPRSGGHHSHLGGNIKGVKKVILPDLSGYPGMELLSLKEQELCQECKLVPKHYLKMKEILMFESMRKGQVRRADAFGMFKIDPIKTDKVYEFLITMGWVQGDVPAVERNFSFV